MPVITYEDVYTAYKDLYEREEAAKERLRLQQRRHTGFRKTIDMYEDRWKDEEEEKQAALDLAMRGGEVEDMNKGFERLALCRRALEALDRRGWERSFHQRMFHDQFLRACAKIFWKTCKPGSFERCHERILESNGWDSLRQEILVSTPRRFGKTISVSMFAAAMLYSTPKLEMSIYSTCKRISQKLLQNVQKFLDLIEIEMGGKKMRVVRRNMEEIVMEGSDVVQDFRIVNSYPSKVTSILL